MSYDLYFWKQSTRVDVAAATTLELIMAGTPPVFVQPLPTETLLESIKGAFPEIEENRTRNPLVPVQLICDTKGGGCFIATWNDWLLTMECHGVNSTDMNTFIDLAIEQGCRLYDPQTDVRYDA